MVAVPPRPASATAMAGGAQAGKNAADAASAKILQGLRDVLACRQGLPGRLSHAALRIAGEQTFGACPFAWNFQPAAQSITGKGQIDRTAQLEGDEFANNAGAVTRARPRGDLWAADLLP